MSTCRHLCKVSQWFVHQEPFLKHGETHLTIIQKVLVHDSLPTTPLLPKPFISSDFFLNPILMCRFMWRHTFPLFPWLVRYISWSSSSHSSKDRVFCFIYLSFVCFVFVWLWGFFLFFFSPTIMLERSHTNFRLLQKTLCPNMIILFYWKRFMPECIKCFLLKRALMRAALLCNPAINLSLPNRSHRHYGGLYLCNVIVLEVKCHSSVATFHTRLEILQQTMSPPWHGATPCLNCQALKSQAELISPVSNCCITQAQPWEQAHCRSQSARRAYRQ